MAKKRELSPPPTPLYFTRPGERRVQHCLKPSEACEHSHHFFLSLALEEVGWEGRRYHTSGEGVVELCWEAACEREHQESRRAAVAFHRERHRHDYRGPWLPSGEAFVSLLEGEVAEVLEATGYRVLRNSRGVIGPHEVDLYLPERGVAVEVNGRHWHSEEALQERFGLSSRSYHLRKHSLCEALGVVLGFVWEDSWLQGEAAVRGALADLVQFRRHQKLLEQFERALPPSDLAWLSADWAAEAGARVKAEARLKRRWGVP